MLPLPQITIRCARHDDLPALQTLAATAVRRLCSADQSRAQIETLLRFAARVDPRVIDDRTYYVVEHAARVVAAGAWSYRAALFGDTHPEYPGDAADILDPAIHPARLRGFFVHPDFARRGIGRTLCALCQGAAARAGFTSIELITGPTGRLFYRACGFEDVEPITHIFPNAVAATGYRMSKELAAVPEDPARRYAHSRVPAGVN